MLEARGCDDKTPPVNKQQQQQQINVAIDDEEFSSHDITERKLLTFISQIDPKKLESINHDKNIQSLVETLRSCLDQDYSQLLLFTQAIKDCGKPCYKRDVLIETLHELLVVQSENNKVLLKLICDISTTSQKKIDRIPWKGMANCLVTLPDLVANCGLMDRFPDFAPRHFNQILLEILYCSLSTIVSKVLIDYKNESSTQREEMALFYAHIIGRIAIAGFRTLVWKKFTSRLVVEEDTKVRDLGSTILCIPIRVAEFEIFIEPLYGPIFYYMRPTPNNGMLIESIIRDSILHNETLQHIVCKKYITQTNFNQDRHRQNLILFNTFSYLSRLVINNKSTTAVGISTIETTKTVGCSGAIDNAELDTKEQKQLERVSNILIETVLEVAKSWSNSTKILLRVYEHNRYISCALVMALKFALEREHRQCLLKRADEIQSKVIHGLQIYLNRSSNELRNVAMCVAEIILTRLHDLVDAELGKNSAKERNQLEFDVEWDESCLAIKKMFQLDFDTFCKELDSNINDFHDDQDDHDDKNLTTINQQHHHHDRNHQSTPVIKAASDEAFDKNNEDSDDDYDDESMDAPIYINDCIDALIDNSKPRYIKLCLIKVGQLIRQLTKEPLLEVDEKVKNKNMNVLKKSTTNDAIRDVAIELAQVLLYVEDQYSINNFDALQRDALVSLTVAAPDLVAKYLLDELNGSQVKNIKHQTIILQILIESAQKLGNSFTKYGALYFYGIVNQLKISTLSAPTSSVLSIVSAVKSMKKTQDDDSSVASDDSYLLSRVLLSVSLIIKCLNQQLITCKLSNDLLDILAAYRHHPDSGVRKAIVSCLTVIRDCTPSVYFREHLNDKTARLFGAWLAIESEFIREDK